MTALKRVFSTRRSRRQNAEEIADIYNAYTLDSNNNSVDTLSSKENLASPINSGTKQRDSKNIPQVHISSRLSSLQLDEDKNITKSAPQTPTSGGSFDFQLRPGNIVTNSSLNVLLDTPNNSAEFRRLVDSPSDINLLENDNIDKENEGWNEKGAAVRKIEDSESKYRVIKRNVKDFTFGKHIGEGSYSTVLLATDKHNSKQYAVKVLDKRHIIKEKKVKYVNIEKHSLNRLSGSKGIISLYFTFQDKDSLYFVLDYASNGELLSLIKKYNTLNEDCVRFLGAQILDAIKFMHDNGVIHRDIKPENILLDDKMRIKITDFGTARLLERKDDESQEYPVDVRAKSFVGTAEYVSPELLENKYCGKPGDVWAFGCILYQMIAGKPPFKATNEYLTFQKITKLQFAFSAGFPLILRDLIKQILVLQPSKRATIPQIQIHPFFESINFEDSDSIWDAAIPELGPYKMTAKSMMKMPEKSGVSNTTHPPSKKSKKKSDEKMKKSKVEANVNPASVAAYVLNKNDNTNTVEVNQTNSNISQKQSSAPDYIPGTNILRPNINKLGSYARPLSRKKVTAKAKPRIMEVSAFGPLEDAWVKYLIHPDERILKTGIVTAYKIPTELLERKYKLKDWNYPVSGSLLSKVVNASSSVNSTYGDEDSYSDENVFVEYYEISEPDEPSSPSVDDNTENSNSNGTRSHSSIFKKFLKSHNDKDKNGKDNASEDTEISELEIVRTNPLDQPRVCTLVVTTHGRALIFLKNKSSSKLITEVKLNYLQVQIREVLQSNNKFQNLFPTSGLFAISTSENCITFEVDKQFLASWTEVLARSKFNQSEREKLMYEESIRKNLEKTTSPVLANSPVFASNNKQSVEHKHTPSASGYSEVTSPRNSIRVSSDHKHQHTMMPGKSKKMSTKRKPPAPIRTAFDSGVSGLGAGSEGGILHAAQLAVNGTSYTTSNPSRSSFTKESPKVSNHSYSTTSNSSSTHKPAITSMNSKFLARSHRKK